MSDPPHIVRVAGPLVEVDCDKAVAMHDLIGLGPHNIPGEVVAISDGRLSVQAYEYTGGLKPGDPVAPRGSPLSAELGPGLLGGVFDGLLRPLTIAPTWLRAGCYTESSARRWQFAPTARVGVNVGAGADLGVVVDVGAIEHRVQVPVGAGGVVESIVAAGNYPGGAVLATVGGTPVSMVTSWPIRTMRPYRKRRDDVAVLHTGQRVVDLLFPIAKGSTASVPGGFGTGKTVLLQQLAKWCDADVIVYVGCGERGNEMAEVVADMLDLADPRKGGRLADRTVIIATTSNMPMMAREASIYTGVTVAEYFRDMGYDVVVIADSTSRWAEALREFASRMGDLPAEEGYPASLATELAAFYERAGYVDTLNGRPGSVTVIGAVSPPGGDMSDPVTVHTDRFVRCRWTLDRDLAYSRHYPAVSWSASFSRDVEQLGAAHTAADDPDWTSRRVRVLALLTEADRVEALTELIGVGALPDSERIELLGGRLLREAVLQQSALVPNDACCSPAKTASLVDSVLAVIDTCRDVVSAGVPANLVEQTDFGRLIRARDDSGPTDTVLAETRRDEVITQLRQLR